MLASGETTDTRPNGGGLNERFPASSGPNECVDEVRYQEQIEKPSHLIQILEPIARGSVNLSSSVYLFSCVYSLHTIAPFSIGSIGDRPKTVRRNNVGSPDMPPKLSPWPI